MASSSLEVSIVIPFHGRLELAHEAITAAFAQKAVTFEVIVVDDGSSESTEAIRVEVEERGGRFVRQAHRGIATARNAGLEAATGEWVAFVDSDDFIYPTKFFRQLMAVRRSRSGEVWSCTGFDLLSPQGQRVGGDSLEKLPLRFWRLSCPFGSTSVLARRDVLVALGGFDVAFDRSEDWDLFIRLGDVSSPVILSDRLYGYRLNCGNVSGRDPERWRSAWGMLRRKHDLQLTVGSYAGIRHNLPTVSETLFYTPMLAEEMLSVGDVSMTL